MELGCGYVTLSKTNAVSALLELILPWKSRENSANQKRKKKINELIKTVKELRGIITC